jgi:hypothetical protein
VRGGKSRSRTGQSISSSPTITRGVDVVDEEEDEDAAEAEEDEDEEDADEDEDEDAHGTRAKIGTTSSL